MRRHLCSLGATIVMILLAFGSVDTGGVSNRNSVGTRSSGTAVTPSSGGAKSDSGSSDATSESAVRGANNDGTDSKTATAPLVHKMKESVHVGYTSYAIWKAWWSNQLSSNQFLNQRPDASYLFVELSVRNDDAKARMIPPFKLIDENNSEYEASSKSWAIPGNIGVLDSLNPGVSKQGIVVFDVPQGHKYKMKISGGFWSTEDSLIEIIDREQEEKEQADKETEARKKREAERRAADEKREAAIDEAKWRTWHSASGKFDKEAKFVKYANGIVTLQYKDGKAIDLQMDKLSEEDQRFINNREWLNVIKR